MKKLLIGIVTVAVIFCTIFFQMYKYFYNHGNKYYEEERYDVAIKEYEQALKLHVPHKKECKIRINLALSMIGELNIDDIKKIKPEQIDPAIETLKGAVEVLCEDRCAHKDDHNGHNEDAQILKEEIENYIKMLEKMKDDSSSNDGDQDNPPPSNEPEEPSSEQQQIENDMAQSTNQHNQGTQNQYQNGGTGGNGDGGAGALNVEEYW